MPIRVEHKVETIHITSTTRIEVVCETVLVIYDEQGNQVLWYTNNPSFADSVKSLWKECSK